MTKSSDSGGLRGGWAAGAAPAVPAAAEWVCCWGKGYQTVPPWHQVESGSRGDSKWTIMRVSMAAVCGQQQMKSMRVCAFV